LIDQSTQAARKSDEVRVARDRFLLTARRALGKPLVRRVYSYEDIGRHRTTLDERAIPLREPMQTIFALSITDHGTNQLLAGELPMLAAAARMTGEEVFIARVRNQLHEMAAWSPLQRPGWAAYAGQLPPDGKDGNWLATGTGVRAIADTLEIMPPETVPIATVTRLHQLLASEIVSIVDDWTARRPWFVRSNMPLTNQWVLPTEGLIRACLVLGRQRHEEAYELGVANLLAHLNAHGDQGAFEEGIHYAEFTLTSLLSIARAMALEGDRRAIDHPFLRQFPIWAIHHFQPAGFFINAFDAFAAARGNKTLLRDMLALAAIALHSREAMWALQNLAGGAQDSLPGVLSRALLRPTAQRSKIKPYAAYTRARRVNWRSDWSHQASGVWVRGGDKFDFHDHMDRGHVNVILQGTPTFIEAGTPAYHNPRLRTDYASGRGHNVLQLGTVPPEKNSAVPENPPKPQPKGWQKAHAPAPIVVHRLDARGGDIEVDGTAGYDDLKAWRRRVLWNERQVTVEDSVLMSPHRPQIVVLRWHLGITRQPRITLEGNGAYIRWGKVRVSIAADTPMNITTELMPDHTLRYRAWNNNRPDHTHVCLVLQTATAVQQCYITTRAAYEAA
jgi:hypothetical protein